MEEKNIVSVINSILSVFSISLGLENMQSILSIIVLIINLIIILSNLVCTMFTKIKKAKQDGKITIDELNEIQTDFVNGLEKIKEEVEGDD